MDESSFTSYVRSKGFGRWTVNKGLILWKMKQSQQGRAVSHTDAMYTISPESVGFCGSDHQFGRKGLPVVIKNGFEGTNFDVPALRL